MKNIIVLAGDGIGPEIVAEGVKIAKKAGDIFNIEMSFKNEEAGGVSIDNKGTPITESVLEACKNADAVIKGPFGGPKWDGLEASKRPEKAILQLRKELELYANLRHVHLFDALIDASTIKPEVIRGLDILIVRELVSGLYFGEPRGIFETDKGKKGVNTLVYHDFEVERIMKKAFDFAMLRNKKVHSVDKFNVLESSQVWHQVADSIAPQYPEVEMEHMIVDNCAMQLISNPKQFDVVVTTNMFGDILSDEASMLSGSLGMLPSASIGGQTGLYEPSHGSAPDIAGEGKANPLATILSIAMMFNYSFAIPEAEKLINSAVEKVLEKGFRTPDIMEPGKTLVSTEEMGHEVLKAMS